MHAAGHATLALAAAGCAQALSVAGSVTGGASLLVTRSGGALSSPRFSGGALAFAAVGLGAVVVKAVGGSWAAWAQARICGDLGNTLRLRVLDGWLALHRLRAPRQRDQGEGDRAARSGIAPLTSARVTRPSFALSAMTGHVRELEAGMRTGVLGAVRAVAQIAPLAVALVWMAPRLAVVAAAVLIVFSAALGTARRAWKSANARAARQREELLEAADEAVRHAELWTTYGAEARVRAHVGDVGRRLADQGARIDASAAALGGANEILGALALVLAIAAARAGWLGAGHEESLLLPFAVTFFLAYRPIRDLTDARLSLARASAAAESLSDLLTDDHGAEPSREPSDPPRDWPLAPLTLDRLRLAHGVEGEHSVRVAPGEVLAIVGATGSGKTTLLRTLLGLEAACDGEVRYGDTRIEDCASGPASRPFAWVPQDAPVLADTLEANIALAPHSSDAHLALDAIGASDLRARAGDARLGAGGRALSGGERQWIALARAVATRQPVLLLDEPTSGLDPASQARVLDAIARLRGERTVILVTHREEPLVLADTVLRMGAPDSAAPRTSQTRDLGPAAA